MAAERPQQRQQQHLRERVSALLGKVVRSGGWALVLAAFCRHELVKGLIKRATG
jgi:hypothetical protein